MTAHQASKKTAGTRWIRASAWAGAFLLSFQLVMMSLLAQDRARAWSASTLGQAAAIALLTIFAFRRNSVALLLLGLLGTARVVLSAMTIRHVITSSSPLSARVAVELVVAMSVALLWIAGAVAVLSAIRARRLATTA